MLLVKKIRTFKCESGAYFDRFADDSERVIKCLCRKTATRQLAAPKYFSNTVGKSPASK